MSFKNNLLVLAVGLVTGLASCPAEVRVPEVLVFSCTDAKECSPGHDCVSGRCVPVTAMPDGGSGDRPMHDAAGIDLAACREHECPDNEICVILPDGSPDCACGQQICGEEEICLADAAGSISLLRCCAGGEANCAGHCVSLGTEDHCADCDDRCAWGESCEGGQCRCGGGAGCNPDSEDCCDGACQDVLSDPSNCGSLGTGLGCGNPCQVGQPCTNGVCLCRVAEDCVAGQTCCDLSYCANTIADVTNCGVCHRTCGAGEVCAGGVCACPTGGCDDGDPCTENICTAGNRCVFRTLDGDDDGYCAPGCDDAVTGVPGDCVNDDCDDGDPERHPDRAELCDTKDNDCDNSTLDGDDESWLGTPCDGADSDLCTEGVWECSGGLKTCSDSTGPNDEICNGEDDDCRPSTLDGAADCDSPDLCCGDPKGCQECCDESQCGFGEVCSAAKVCTCGSGAGCGQQQDCCGDTCYDVLTDDDHCGPVGTGVGCSRACPDGQPCVDGFCSCETAADCGGQTCCDETYCADLETDRQNCGSCGNGCRVGEVCQGGTCRCAPAGCNDGIWCTSNICCVNVTCGADLNRCLYPTRDEDHDGYCEETCLDAVTGSPGDCIDGDCDDTDGSVHPGATELCNGRDDDCDPGTVDESECAGLCCGAPACQQCCENDDCGAGKWLCNSAFSCVCATKECQGNYCLDTSAGDECCVPGDCGGGDYSCTSHLCRCDAGVVCDGICIGGGACCGDADCSTDNAPHCRDHQCTCDGIPCAGVCHEGGVCCIGPQCGSGNWDCLAHQCSCVDPKVNCGGSTPYCRLGDQCCDGGDCPPGGWDCVAHACSCPSVVCDPAGENYCLATGEGEDCCDGGDCGTGAFICEGHHCGCVTKICEGTTDHCLVDGEVCCPGVEGDCPLNQTCGDEYTCQCAAPNRTCSDGYCATPAECCAEDLSMCGDGAPEWECSYSHACTCDGGSGKTCPDVGEPFDCCGQGNWTCTGNSCDACEDVCGTTCCGTGDWNCDGDPCNCPEGQRICSGNTQCCGPGFWYCQDGVGACSCDFGVLNGRTCGDECCGFGSWRCVDGGNTCDCQSGKICGNGVQCCSNNGPWDCGSGGICACFDGNGTICRDGSKCCSGLGHWYCQNDLPAGDCKCDDNSTDGKRRQKCGDDFCRFEDEGDECCDGNDCLDNHDCLDHHCEPQ